jgi:hypothetical protein
MLGWRLTMKRIARRKVSKLFPKRVVHFMRCGASLSSLSACGCFLPLVICLPSFLLNVATLDNLYNLSSNAIQKSISLFVFILFEKVEKKQDEKAFYFNRV